MIQIFNYGAERVLGFEAADVINRITAADISDPQARIARTAELSRELRTPISSGFEAMVLKTSYRTENIYELSHIQLPGMDGLAATALLKQDPETSAIPVIALTAMAMKADQEKSQIAGCDDYIAKPLRYQELYAAIDVQLERSRAAKAATSGQR